MALYASDEDGYIFAADATPGISYRCTECADQVKVRRGRDRFPHFYHLQRSPRCRLYSKSEDHLILQLQLQKLLSKDTAQIERPFFSIHRISDLVWEKEKIAFEIQCSSLDISEASKRVVDYGNAGYQVVWLLDDRVFNRRAVREAETFLRSHICYFFSFQRIGDSFFYDQMEIIIQGKRFTKGSPLRVDLSKPHAKPFLEWPPNLPNLIQERINRSEIYFRGDLMHKIIQAPMNPITVIYLERWRTIEIKLHESNQPPSLLSEFFKRYFLRPYIQFLEWLIERVNQ